MADRRVWIARMAARDDWLAQVQEPIIDPAREIVDPHHHLWDRNGARYLLEQLWTDTNAGHNLVQTVFVECRSGYLDDGPTHLRPVGETRFVADIASASAANPNAATVAAIVSHADLRHPDLDAVLDAHIEAGRGLFRGIRHAGTHEPSPDALTIPGRAPAGLYSDADFRRGVARLGERGLTYDTWHYHHQNRDFRDLALAVPGTTLVLDHFGTPLGVGQYAGRRAEIFAAWKDDIAAIAECPNVVAKLGGLAMPDNGFGWHERAAPPTMTRPRRPRCSAAPPAASTGSDAARRSGHLRSPASKRGFAAPRHEVEHRYQTTTSSREPVKKSPAPQKKPSCWRGPASSGIVTC